MDIDIITMGSFQPGGGRNRSCLNLHPNFPEPYQVITHTRTLQNFTGYLHGTFQILTRYLHLNFLKPSRIPAPQRCQVSAPEPTGTHRNPPERRQVSKSELSTISAGICTGRNPPEPGVDAPLDHTRANLG